MKQELSAVAVALMIATASCSDASQDLADDLGDEETPDGYGARGPDDGDAGTTTRAPDDDGANADASTPKPKDVPLVDGLILDGVAMYQVLKVSLVANGKSVTSSLPIVAGREALLRVFVRPSDTWSPRPVTARLTLVTKGEERVYEDERTLSTASTDARLDSTFTFDVRAKDIASDTTWKIELMDLAKSAPKGDPAAARWPREDDASAPLGAQNIGNLKVRFVPIKLSNGLLPDVDAATRDLYRDYMRALFPVPDVEVSVAPTFTYSGAIPKAGGSGWSSLLDTIVNKHRTDKPARDVYYVGLFRPASTFSAYCGGGCVSGLASQLTEGSVIDYPEYNTNVIAAFKLADARGVAESMAHEIGHNHGRDHAPCEISADDIDPKFPDKKGGIGTWGYDSRSETLIDPMPNAKWSLTSSSNPPRDVMSYCNKSTWISGYTYQHVAKRSALVNAWKPTMSSGPPQRVRRLHVEPDGTVELGEVLEQRRLGAPEERVDLIDARGQARSERGLFIPYDHLPGGTLLVPEEVVTSFVGARLASTTLARAH